MTEKVEWSQEDIDSLIDYEIDQVRTHRRGSSFYVTSYCEKDGKIYAVESVWDDEYGADWYDDPYEVRKVTRASLEVENAYVKVDSGEPEFDVSDSGIKSEFDALEVLGNKVEITETDKVKLIEASKVLANLDLSVSSKLSVVSAYAQELLNNLIA